ncbi:molybdate ABC transporter substrate-binding protein [Rhodobacter capsulatus]|uniref:Molybdate ABC transporter substrate-binding protein n=1 Tax=Rhodobacter capsulatus TaxID=1061 RepID=A0A4U1JMV3_RHOCA|nr:molybdate ABC transporter substrate-binding protein [Rhodobacter capsulatus]TKD15589.1 molybdate ABC transporter substrate-binding protein [Rhodobacter capsulatus]
MTHFPQSLRAGSTALALVLALAVPAAAGEVIAAVAANFTEPAKEIATLFTEKTGHTVTYTFGPSGQFYTQITQGAPFEVFLSADASRPKKAIEEGYAVAGTDFTYAVGKLVLWSADPARVDDKGAVLKTDLEHVAIADPKSAPYGAAAIEVMQKLGVYETLEPKLVTGKSITQAYEFAATGNAPVGFVAYSQVIGKEGGSSWMVPADLYKPIKQDAVLLKTGAEDAAAKAYLDFLKTPEALEIIKKYGYVTE